MLPGPPKKKVIFCLPGRQYSNRFLLNWSNVLVTLLSSGDYDVRISNEYSSFVSFARARCLGASVERGMHQKPFGGQIDYDVLVWIDSDIYFTVGQVIELIDSALRDHPVVSGVYMMEDNTHFACVREWNDAYFLQHGTYAFETVQSLQLYVQQAQQQAQAQQGIYLPCAYAGMGFMAIRKGILEQLPYPWFYRNLHRIPTGNPALPELVEQCSEDVSLCRNMIDAGIIPAIMVKLNLRVGHEKIRIL